MCCKKAKKNRGDQDQRPTRESCLECVEKHLGAAWVQVTECREGYDHRILAIGHMYEAEDESQQWPKLHTAIRQERKAFQTLQKPPDFPLLARLLERVYVIEIAK